MKQPPTWTHTLLRPVFILFGKGVSSRRNLGVAHLPVRRSPRSVSSSPATFRGEKGAVREAVTLEKRPFITFLQAPVRPPSFGIAATVSRR